MRLEEGPPVDSDSARVWNGRHVVLFLGAIMILIGVVMAIGASALMDDKAPSPTEQIELR